MRDLSSLQSSLSSQKVILVQKPSRYGCLIHSKGFLRHKSHARRRLNFNQPKSVRTADMIEADKRYIADSIRGVPDFPHKGILFHDVTTLLLDPKAFRLSIDDFVERYQDKKIEAVAGFEARGFIFGAPVALALGVPFIPLRKPKKLPGETLSAEYDLEYGKDRIEVHKGAIKEGQRVLLLDDLIATGGTLGAGIQLVKLAGGEVVEAACIIEMPDLKGRSKLGDIPLYCQIEKAGD